MATWRLLLGVAMLSASMLLIELLKTIVLSLQLFHQNAFLVVSLSLVGLGGGGSLAALVARKRPAAVETLLWPSAVAFGISIVLVELASTRLTAIPVLVAINTIPYIFVGLFLSLTFLSRPQDAGRIYFFDLVGAAAGCVGLVFVLNASGSAGAVVLTASALALAGSAAIAHGSRLRLTVSCVLLITVLGAVGVHETLFPYRPGPVKHYGRILADPQIQSRLDWSRWGFLGRLDSVAPIRGFDRLIYDVATGATRDGCETRYLFASGDNWSYTYFCPPHAPGFLDRLARSSGHRSPYLASPPEPDVLNIGLGGGIDVFLALRNGAKTVTGVEINPMMIEAVRDKHRAFFGDPFHDPRVTIKELDGRTFVNSTKQSFDVITLTAVDTGAGLAAGANLLSENYLYTQEAFEGYFRILRPGGVIYIFRPLHELQRALTTAMAALQNLGEAHPERHAAVFHGGAWSSALLARKPFAPETLAKLREALPAAPMNMTIDYLPGMPGGHEGLAVYFAKVAQGRGQEFLDSLAENFTPVTDDSPYFYQLERNLLTSAAGRVLLKVLLCVLGLAVLLMLVPLIGLESMERGPFITVLVYFSAIGLGFMFVEIAMVQKLALFLGHPSYSVTTTIFSMLVFSGLGALVGVPLVERGGELRKVVPFLAVCLAILGYAVLTPALGRIAAESLAWRTAVTVALLAPGSFFMGIPLPLMIARLPRLSPLIPWAWAANAFASVVGSVGTVMLAMVFGFTTVLLLAAIAYLVALVVMLRGHSILRR